MAMSAVPDSVSTVSRIDMMVGGRLRRSTVASSECKQFGQGFCE
jgi:hypothetical protein